MSVYTISPCLIRGCEKNGDVVSYRTVLMKFLSGESKVAKDEHGWVIDLYGSLPDKHGIINSWLTMMGASPSRFEKIPVDLVDMKTEEGKFIKLCKETKGNHKMIVYSVMNLRGDFNNYEILEKNKKYQLKIDDNNSIELFDKDEAVFELGDEKEVHYHNDTNISESIIAGGDVKVCCTMKSRHGRAGKKHIRLQNGNYFLSLQCEVKSARKECFLWGNIIIH